MSVRRKVSLSCLSRLSRVCRGELVAGSLSKEHPRTPRFRLCKTERCRRQGWSAPEVSPGQGRKAHPEPLPSLDDRSDPQAFHHNPAQRPGLALDYQCCDYAPLQSRPPCLCSLIAAALRRGSGSRACRGRSRSHSLLSHRAYSSERRTAISAVAAGGSCIMRARSSCPHPIDSLFGTDLLFHRRREGMWPTCFSWCSEPDVVRTLEPAGGAGLTKRRERPLSWW